VKGGLVGNNIELTLFEICRIYPSMSFRINWIRQ
jgi:hypothetical protein